MATKFSNTPNSLQSSLGFYVTAETYYGKNGLSLFIDGMEEKFNSKARERYVVIHGADYAKEESIKRLGRLGRSYGCPAVPYGIHFRIINAIKGGSCVFVSSPDDWYTHTSAILNSGSDLTPSNQVTNVISQIGTASNLDAESVSSGSGK